MWETLNAFFSKLENPHLCCSCTDPFNCCEIDDVKCYAEVIRYW